MKRLLILLLLSTKMLIAQNNGLILEDAVYEKIQLDTTKERTGSINLMIDLRPFCPTPGDQGDMPSCVAWALANLLTIQTAINKKESNRDEINDGRYSVAYIYNQINHKGKCNNGAAFSRGLELLKTKGDCLAKNFPYNPLSCVPLPDEHHHKLARTNKIKNYIRLFDVDDDPMTKLNRVLDQLTENKPVLIGLFVPNDFRILAPEKSNNWNGTSAHAMVVVGYNDLDETFLLMNSYGVDWGQNGFIHVSYEVFMEEVFYGYVVAF